MSEINQYHGYLMWDVLWTSIQSAFSVFCRRYNIVFVRWKEKQRIHHSTSSSSFVSSFSAPPRSISHFRISLYLTSSELGFIRKRIARFAIFYSRWNVQIIGAEQAIASQLASIPLIHSTGEANLTWGNSGISRPLSNYGERISDKIVFIDRPIHITLL